MPGSAVAAAGGAGLVGVLAWVTPGGGHRRRGHAEGAEARGRLGGLVQAAGPRAVTGQSPSALRELAAAGRYPAGRRRRARSGSGRSGGLRGTSVKGTRTDAAGSRGDQDAGTRGVCSRVPDGARVLEF